MDRMPLVSVIIPTRNAESVLENCLKSLRAQTYVNTEVLIVDNYSQDKTTRMAEKYGVKVVEAGPRNAEFFTAPALRRIGAKNVSGEFLFFIDADMILKENVVMKCVEECLAGADAVRVHEISFGKGFWALCKAVERSCYVGDSAIDAPRFVKRFVYEQIGGWNEEVGALDDWDLYLRLQAKGYRIANVLTPIFHNEGELTLRRLFNKKYRMGRSVHLSKYLSTHKAFPKSLTLQLTPLRMIKLLIKSASLSKNPLRVLAIFLMKAIEGSAFLLGLALQNLKRQMLLSQRQGQSRCSIVNRDEDRGNKLRFSS